MADGRFPTLISKSRDANSASNPIFISLVDSDGDELAVDASGRLSVVLGANDGVDIGDVTINNGAGASAVNIQDGGNSITVDDGGTTLSVDDGGGSITVDGTVTANVSSSESSPVYVTVVNTAVSGSEIHDYDTATVASDGTSNHDYTVANTTFLLKKIVGASSGAAKFEIQSGPVASLTTKAVFFVPARGGKDELTFEPALEVPVTSTGTVRIIRTNLENQSQDLYSTIMGNDI